jgi:hypothetical protein
MFAETQNAGGGPIRHLVVERFVKRIMRKREIRACDKKVADRAEKVPEFVLR